MAELHPIVHFSACGEYLACCTNTGILQIWQCANGQLQQEFAYSSRLSAQATCLQWAPRNVAQARPKKKQKQESTQPLVAVDKLLALGNSNGGIVIYSISRAEVQTVLERSHTAEVNGLSWDPERDALYSCGSDTHVVRWSLSLGSRVAKWKADDYRVTAVAVSPDGLSLLTSGRTIKWWDIEKQQVLKSFIGHMSDVFQLQFVVFPDLPTEEGYFLSAAVGDYMLCAWRLKGDGSSSVGALAVGDECYGFSASIPESKDAELLVSVITSSGVLHIYQHHFNGGLRHTKPLRPSVKLKVKPSEEGEQIIPVIAAHVCSDGENIHIAHGISAFLKFEKQSFSLCQKETVLLRHCSSSILSSSHSTKFLRKVTVPPVAQHVAHFVPAHITPLSVEEESKRQNSMEEKLRELSLSSVDSDTSSRGLSHQVIQGLVTHDTELLESALYNASDDIVELTATWLPITAVVPFLQEIRLRLHKDPTRKLILMKWIESLTVVHSAYLCTCPDGENIVSSIYHLLDSRASCFHQLSALHGRLCWVLDRAEEKKSHQTKLVGLRPLNYFQEDWSSEEELDEDTNMDAECLPDDSELPSPGISPSDKTGALDDFA